MSQQPYMYTPYTGRQAQQAYPYSSTPGQPPGLTFGAPPATSPSSVAGNFAAANRSFEYNASRIPGLGMGGNTSPSFSASLFRAENKPLWPQALSESSTPAAPPVPAAPAAPAGPAAITTRPAVGGGQKQLQAPASAPVSGHTSQTQRQGAAGDALEEGELSDDESEDIYEPKHSPEGAVKKANQAFRPASTAVDQQGSAGDADGSSIYDTGSSREEVIDSASASLPAVEENEEEYSPGGYEDSVAYQPRDRSGSYSPYLSPREVQKEAPGARRSFQETQTVAAQHHAPLPTSGADNDVPASRKVPAQAANGHVLSVPAPAQRSAAVAKKKAQEAILGLWPLKVRYQDYIDEGLDPVVVKKLFTDLGLDMSSPKTTNTPAKPTVPVGVASNAAAPHSAPIPAPAPAPALTASTTSAQPQTTNPATSTTANSTSEMTAVDKKSEERKDKIARMLAEKKQKSAPASSLNAATTTSSTTSAPTAPQAPAADPKAKTKAENTLKLQQKLAILRKAQEENEAKKKREQAAVIQPSSAPTPNGGDQGPAENTPGADSTPAPSKQVSPSVDPEAVSPAPGIPGLNLPAHLVATKGRVAKRPVAADFDAYPPATGFPKRSKIQERLIIDVSDDEDVEMDIGSPVDGPAGGIQTQSSNTPHRPNSLGAFPPLSTSTTWRHKSSPVQTPPERSNKLDFLHRQIEEAKRKIAEAEAKKKASRQSNGTSSPLAQTPAPAEAASNKLPKSSDRRKSTPRASSERRERIASIQLPLLESALKEKQEKLKRLQMEATQLELEVQASLAERQQLTLEMSTLDDSNDDDTEESAPLSPPNNQDSTAPITAPPDAASTPLNEEAELMPTAVQPTGLTAQKDPDTEMSDGKSEMDIDSTDSSDTSSSAAEDVPVDIDNKSHADVPGTEAMNTENHATMNLAVSPPNPPRSEIESKTQHFGTGDAKDSAATGTEDMLSQSETQAVNDADASLQASVARVSPLGDEPVPAQISRADQVHVSDDEEGEVPDEDPYEPSLAAPAESVPEHAAQAPTGEVQLRPSGKSHVLTNKQTEQAPLVPVQDLLSYQSPLRYFRAYRFHPKYSDSVRGGLRSKTYSSKVRSDVPLCPSSGERDTCPNGSSCQYQHFSDMAATDSDIIASLGSVDSYSREQRGRFIEGLKKVLSDLKSDPNRVKNFDSITAAILEYRRDFFGGDDTKVLPLDGVSI